MKKLLTTLIIVGCFLVIAPTAKAVMVANGGDLSDWDGKTAIPAALYDLAGIKLTNLNTSIAELYGSVYKTGKTIMYVSTKGIMSLTLGQAESKAKTLYKKANLEDLVHSGSTWVIADSTKGAKQPVFIYDSASKKVKNFGTKISEPSYASLAKGGTMVAIIGKDTSAKDKIFVSRNALTTVTASNLPTGFSSCSALALAPGGTYLALKCETSSRTTSVVVVPVKDGKLGKAITVKYGDLIPGPMTWLNETTLVSMGTAVSITADDKFSYDPSIVKITIKNNKATVATPVSLGATTTVPAGDMIIAPLQIQALSATKILYVYEYIGLDSNNVSVFSSVVGSYQLNNKKNSVLVNLSDFHFLAETGF